MNMNAGVVKHPRRLVVDFYEDPSFMIQTDNNDRPQLVHYQEYIEKPSVFIRFATRLGLRKEDKPMMNAVEKAYAFVSGNYRQGDQVVLLVHSYFDRHMDAAEMLAKHLRYGIRSTHLLRVKSNNMGEASPEIPIHGVVVHVHGKIINIFEWNDKLKSRFPPGIQHIVCWGYEHEFQSCATRCDADGSTISREICVSRHDDPYGLWEYCTKHVIYYNEYLVPQWDHHKPVWTRKLDSSSSNIQGSLPLETTKPFGMYVHELRNYQGLPLRRRHISMLVWRSHRSTDERP